jgi:hypothetical protein
VTESGEQLAEVPTGTETLYLTVVVALPSLRVSRSDYDRARAALLSGRARLVLDTDLPGREHIETVLTDTRVEPSNIGRCSPTA